MGIYAFGCGKHRILCKHPRVADTAKKPLGAVLGMTNPHQKELPEMGNQRRRAVNKMEQVHVVVRAAVRPVHQTRLRGGADLVKQTFPGHCRNFVGSLLGEVFPHDPIGFMPKEFRTVGAAAGAFAGRPVADQAAPSRNAEAGA